MSSLISQLAAVLAIYGTTVSSHMILSSPTPYAADTITNSPLSSSGSNYPCQISGDAATFYSTSGISNEYTAGESLTMSFKGSAVHGGGSCQVALSTDMQPSQTTRWSVILSIEGGCPTKDGTTAGTYDVTIPSDIPAGTYSYAWTWTSKESGTQEYYMNCAPVTIKAASGSKKRSTNLRARSDALDSYPPLAVYNLADLNSCKSTLSSDPTYPVPGAVVEHLLDSSLTYTPVAITGTDCFATGVTYDNTTSSSGDDTSSSTTTAAAAGSETASSSAVAAPSSSSTADAGSGGVFATGGGGSGSTATSTAVASGSTGSSSGSGSGSGSSSGSATTSSTVSSATGSSSSASGSCTAGDYNCASSGTTYQMCVAGGTWSVSMPVAAGTECSPGTASTLTIAATASSKKRRFISF